MHQAYSSRGRRGLDTQQCSWPKDALPPMHLPNSLCSQTRAVKELGNRDWKGASTLLPWTGASTSDFSLHCVRPVDKDHVAMTFPRTSLRAHSGFVSLVMDRGKSIKCLYRPSQLSTPPCCGWAVFSALINNPSFCRRLRILHWPLCPRFL